MSVMTGIPYRFLMSDRTCNPIVSPGPLYDVREVLFALSKEALNMISILYSFLNEDRHTNNIAVLYDLEKKEYDYCPYFDMGLSLFADVKQDFPVEKSLDACKKDIIAKPFSDEVKL